MHKGDAIRVVLHDFPRFVFERLPPYTPQLNLVEYLWNHLKYDILFNFVPDDVLHINRVLNKRLHRAMASTAIGA
jgi:transposase